MLNIISNSKISFSGLLPDNLVTISSNNIKKTKTGSMKEVHLIWQDFVEQNNKHLIKTWVDIQRGHELLKTSIAFKRSRLSIDTFNTIIMLSIIGAVVLFAFNIWGLAIIITVLSLIVLQVVREEASNAIIRTALNSEVFYYNAINSRILKVLAYRSDEGQ